MASVCVILGEDTELIGYLDQTETLLTAFALEFGEKCGLFSMIDSLLDAAKDFVEPLEQALKTITDAISKVYNELKRVFDQVLAVVEEGLAILKSAMVAALAIIDEVVNRVNALVDGLFALVAEAANALASALCNTLNSAITGMPSDVVLKTPGLAAAAALDAAVPQEFLKQAMQERANAAKGEILESIQQLDAVTNLPNLRAYACTPLGNAPGTGSGGFSTAQP